jgi:hypothetical protein
MRRPRAWSWSPGTSRRGCAEKTTGPPRFLGNPDVNVPCSPTPAGSRAPGQLRRRDAAFRPVNNVGSRGLYSSRGSMARPVHWLSTLRSAGRPGTTQDSLPAAGQALPGGGRYPAGSQRKVSALQSLPPLPSFPGALTGEYQAENVRISPIAKRLTSSRRCHVWCRRAVIRRGSSAGAIPARQMDRSGRKQSERRWR